MTRSRRFFGGLSLGYSYQAVVMLVGLWLTPFLLKRLGQHDYGLWLVGLQILSYLMLMDFGVVALLPRETAYATGRAISGEPGRDLAQTIGTTARVVLWQTPVVALGVVAFWFLMPVQWRDFRGPITVIMLGFTALFPVRIFQAALHGLQETPYLGRLQFLSWTLNTGLTILFVLAGFGLYALAVGWVVGGITTAVFSFFRLKKCQPGAFPPTLPKLSWRELLRALSSGFWVSMAQVAQVLVAGTDYIIIGRVLGPSAVVPYACTQKLISVLGNQPYMIMEMAAPGLSQMKTSETRQRIFQVCTGLTLGMLTAAGAIACVTLAVNHSFVSWWLGERQFGGSVLTALLVAAMLLRHWNTTSVYSIFALGYERRISITTLIDGGVTLSAGVLLVWLIGPIGAPLGALLGVCAVSLPGNLSALAGELEVSIFDVIKSIWPWIWRFILVGSAALLIGLRWHANLPYVVGTASAIGVLYCAVMLPMIMDSPVRAYVPARGVRAWDALCRRLSWTGTIPVQQELEAPKNR